MTPYKNDAINKIYDLLFCDELDLYKDSYSSPVIYPWDVLFQNDPKSNDLGKIINDAELDTRQKIIAANILRSRGTAIDENRLFAVIVEVAMAEGLDVLAAYEDGSSRYINYSEKLIVWDATTSESNALLVALFAAAQTVVDNIGPWDGQRLPPPITGNIGMSFLVSGELYFGEGPFEALANDAMGGPVINCAAKLMEFLVENSLFHSA